MGVLLQYLDHHPVRRFGVDKGNQAVHAASRGFVDETQPLLLEFGQRRDDVVDFVRDMVGALAAVGQELGGAALGVGRRDEISSIVLLPASRKAATTFCSAISVRCTSLKPSWSW